MSILGHMKYYWLFGKLAIFWGEPFFALLFMQE
jgi:hypothetical protein